MIHIVNQTNRHLYGRQLWDLFVERRKSSIMRNGWDDLTVFDGAEVDDFDDERAVYLMALEDDGRLLGAVRARPTDDKCILFDRYPRLIAPGQPSLAGPQTWEVVRVFTTDRFRESSMPGQRGFFGLALASREVALDAGATRMVTIMDVRRLDQLPSVEIWILGLPADCGYGAMVGATVAVSAANNARTLEGLAESVRISYEISDDDVTVFGSVRAAQNAVEAARWMSHDEAAESLKDPVRAIAEAAALFARHDVMIDGVFQRQAGAC